MAYQLQEINRSIRADVAEFLAECDQSYAQRDGMPENIGDDLRRCILLLDGSLPTALLSVSGK